MTSSPLPFVPEDERPKTLFHAGTVNPAEAMSQGWLVVDVRLMPNKTEEDRRNSVRAWLEGVRMGTIEPDTKKLKFLELEAKILGMLGTKPPANPGNPDPNIQSAVERFLAE